MFSCIILHYSCRPIQNSLQDRHDYTLEVAVGNCMKKCIVHTWKAVFPLAILVKVWRCCTPRHPHPIYDAFVMFLSFERERKHAAFVILGFPWASCKIRKAFYYPYSSKTTEIWNSFAGSRRAKYECQGDWEVQEDYMQPGWRGEEHGVEKRELWNKKYDLITSMLLSFSQWH